MLFILAQYFGPPCSIIMTTTTDASKTIPVDESMSTRGLTRQPIAWKPTTHPTAIEPDEVHLWFVNAKELLNSLPKLHFAEILNLGEQQRANKLHNPEKRSLYIAGRIGLRILINTYTSCPIQQIQLEYGENGKPSLKKNLGKLHFNYSVSSNHALYAFSMTRELGVDLEIHPRNINVKGLSQRILSPVERRLFNELQPAQHNTAMLDYWTRKEAYGKLLGVGIRYNMNQTILIDGIDSAYWCTTITGLFGRMSHRRVNEKVCGIQIGLPVRGSATLMYNVPEAACSHPNLHAYLWSLS